ncbi:unnamed protein product [Gongylonema pulchrum]|uniref:Uncharacterized protein n=1 Tax=Gongylonema pulchrum TaxID=637853 RepID=A0A183ENW8_9BILA|nr:unnamed protein product [Gongylonema pulchrum]
MTELPMAFAASPSINCLTARECQEQSCEHVDPVQEAAGHLIFLDKRCLLHFLHSLEWVVDGKILEDNWSRSSAVQMDMAQDC